MDTGYFVMPHVKLHKIKVIKVEPNRTIDFV